MQLRPVSYTWKDKNLSNGKPKLGLIAQEVQAVMNEVVEDKDWIQDEGSTKKREVEAGRMGIYYSDIIPVLINAIQEQQDLIKNQNSKIENLTAESNQKDETLKVFDTRLKQIERVLKQTNQ